MEIRVRHALGDTLIQTRPKHQRINRFRGAFSIDSDDWVACTTLLVCNKMMIKVKGQEGADGTLAIDAIIVIVERTPGEI